VQATPLARLNEVLDAAIGHPVRECAPSVDDSMVACCLDLGPDTWMHAAHPDRTLDAML